MRRNKHIHIGKIVAFLLLSNCSYASDRTIEVNRQVVSYHDDPSILIAKNKITKYSPSPAVNKGGMIRKYSVLCDDTSCDKQKDIE